ncbi:MAG TPA: addiction module protein [Pyrinomonadaceae bacterium]|nr:addiction module protein [Pyrinomonadaceae bacterium]
MKDFKADVSGYTDLVEDIAKLALALPPDLRAILADRLLESLVPKTLTQEEIDAAWIEEAERRSRDIDEGRVTPIPGEEVMARLRPKFNDE